MCVDVVIAGAGPNGLMLACELGLAGIRPVVLERLPAPSTEPKANGLLGQVVRMVDRRGLYERLSGSPGPPRPAPGFMFAGLPLDLGLLEENPVYTLPVPQPRLVEVLAERARELGVEVRWGHELAGLGQDGDGVTAEVAGPEGPYRLRARYLAGADGAHSATRKLAGIDFPGVTYDRTTARTAHVTVPGDLLDPATGGLRVPGFGPVPAFLGTRTEHGSFSYAPFAGRPPLVTTTEWDQPEATGPMTLDELRASVRRVLGADLPLEPPEGSGPHVLRRRVGGNNRVAERFRDRRVFLLGDAAHVDAAGGQGLNLGLQDAINLGWKLAAEVRGTAPEGLLESFDTERRQAARRVTMYAQALSAMLAPGSDVTALRELFTELLNDRDLVRRLAELTAGTDLRHDMGDPDAHPAVGRCAPDLCLDTGDGTVRLAELVRIGRPLLLDLTEDGLPAEPGGVEVVRARAQAPVTALLLRPDSYVAWASSSARPSDAELRGLTGAVARWFGTPVPE